MWQWLIAYNACLALMSLDYLCLILVTTALVHGEWTLLANKVQDGHLYFVLHKRMSGWDSRYASLKIKSESWLEQENVFLERKQHTIMVMGGYLFLLTYNVYLNV